MYGRITFAPTCAMRSAMPICACNRSSPACQGVAGAAAAGWPVAVVAAVEPPAGAAPSGLVVVVFMSGSLRAGACVHAARNPTGDATIGTKRGSASIRASQSRTRG